MKGLYAVYRKEMAHYFVSPVAYIIVGVFLVLSAYFFNRLLVYVIQQSFEYSLQAGEFGGGPSFDVPALVMRNYFGVLSTLLLFLTPMLTMSVYAEERRRGTMELLMTSPVTDLQIVLGKFFASLTLLILMLLPTVVGFAYIILRSDPSGGIAAQNDISEYDHRGEQHQDQQRERGEKFPQDDLQVRYGRGHEQLHGAPPALLGVNAHGQHGSEKEQERGKNPEVIAHHQGGHVKARPSAELPSLQAVFERLLNHIHKKAIEEIGAQDKKDAHDDISNR